MSSRIVDLINEHLDAGDPDVVAEQVMEAAKVPTRFRDLFHPLVRQEARLLARHRTLDIERATILGAAASMRASNSSGVATSAAPSRSELLAESFYTGERYVTWGQATVADHQGRIDFQTLLRNGVDRDIARHHDAISEIEANDVTCLDEIVDDDREVAA